MNFKDLPIYREKEKIVDALKENQVIVVESPTGSGKTTQLPIILHESGYTAKGVVGVTQPRRIAALSVCDFIAEQLKSSVPGFVGYKMRFEDKTNHETYLKIMTDGTLLQEIKSDPLLSSYSVIMVDEAHERSLNIDFILGLLKNILQERSEFRVIISSATINPLIFSNYYNNCPIVHIDSQMYPVQMVYDAPTEAQDYNEVLVLKIVQTVERIVKENRKGDILIFLSGEKIIKDTASMLYASEVRKKLFIIPLYGRLGKEEQEKVFVKTPMGKTKVVISTNIAETSITIDGITSVIDSGLCKLNYYNPMTFTSSLIETGISKASANQRKGRAGRTRPGSCYRLYSRDSFDKRTDFTAEEIYRTDLTEVVLRMAEIGIDDFYSFDFISSPGRKGIASAIDTLLMLEAIDSENHLTDIGKMMVIFPLMPRHSRMIVEAVKRYPDVLREVIIATAFLSTNTPFLLPQGEEIAARQAHHHFQDPSGDFSTYLKLFYAYTSSSAQKKFCEKYYLDEKRMNEIVNIVEQLEEIVSGQGIPISTGGPTSHFLSACARGLIQYICVRSGRGVYSSATAEKIIIHPGSVMFRESPLYIVAGEIVKTTKTWARSVSPLKKEWLNNIYPGIHKQLGKKGGKTSPRPERDTTSTFTLSGEAFPVTKNRKGKKIVQIDWTRLDRAVSDKDLKTLPDFRGLRGNLYYKGTEIVNNAKVMTITRIVKTINPKDDIIKGFPTKNYQLDNDAHLRGLCEDLFFVLKISTGGKRKHKKPLFISLQNNGSGSFWFKGLPSFNAAVAESLDSLEIMADQLSEDLPEQQWEKVNKIYRKLDNMYSL